MKCPNCQTDNPEENKFCRECGNHLLLACPHCQAEIFAEDKFCGKCGQKLDHLKREKVVAETGGERKYVTVLFSDLSGYTAMSEKLDPEEVKEIVSRIFGEIAQVVAKYEGFIEKFVGDAVMALFGVPKAHEDDPVRAILAAREIHDLVEAMSPGLEEKIGRPISMHSGINTGLVVTGEVNIEKGTHGVAGDTINLASRLQSFAKKGEILVGQDTFRQTEGHFTFKSLEPATLKGKAEAVRFYKLISQKDKPITTHRLSGLRAELIGRRSELSQLNEAIESLSHGKGRIFSICGDAGTGKSRLIEEFKAGLDLKEIQWLEGHAYAYSQNIPYFPVTDLLNRVFEIEEGNSPETVRNKLETGIKSLVDNDDETVPYVGSLYSLDYPEVENVSPEFWKSRLQEAMLTILTALARKSPTVFFLEDLHWADPSSVELLRSALQEIRQPAIVLCVHRPVFSLFTSHQLGIVAKIYREIRLQDLSLSDAENMLESLLDAESIPSDLTRFVQDKAEGNPFYLEELVNSLIESEMLIRSNGNWIITKPISDAEISSTIHGLISGRLDRLEKETKRIFQEASVIGRAFLYDILKKVTELEDRVDQGLSTLERLDLIRTRSVQPDIEYMFKHPLTQEVVYNSLLKKERQDIHEQIARVMEQLFRDRIPEFYETLAFHYKQSRSVPKAVHYLIKSGEKSLRRYAVEESHQHFKEAFDLLSNKSERTREEEGLLIDLLLKWALVFYYRGDFRELTPLMDAHEVLAESLEDKERLGLFRAWQGWALFNRHRYKTSYEYLINALELGEEIQSQKLIGYACCWLAWTCTNRGFFDEAIGYGERALKIAQALPSDQYLYFKSLGGIGWAYHFRGDKRMSMETGSALLEYGKRNSNIRSMVLGHYIIGFAHYNDDEILSAIEACKNAAELAADPYYFQFSKLLLGVAQFKNGQFEDAEEAIRDVLLFTTEYGCENVGIPASANLGVLMMAKGHMGLGLKEVEEAINVMTKEGSRAFQVLYELTLGQVYLQIVDKSAPVTLSVMAKNIGFIIKNIPSAAKKAEDHLIKALGVAEEIGAKCILGKAYLYLGFLHKRKGKTDQAKESISQAVQVFEQGELENCLKAAKEALASLE